MTSYTRVITNVLVQAIGIILICNYSYAQSVPLKTFWNDVKLRQEHNIMPSGINAWLAEIAMQVSNNSYSEASALLENIHQDKVFQDQIFLDAYCRNHYSKENLRMILAHMCGKYTVANPISDYIFDNYSTDERAIKRIENFERQEIIERQEKIVRDSIRAIEAIKPVEIMPQFDGNLWEFINSNLVYPEEALNNSISGRVIVKFTVTKDGKVTNCELVRRKGNGLDEEALRVVKLTSGKWRPGTSDGQPVDVVYELPIAFKL